MDWRSLTFDWNRVRAFLVSAEEGSFSAAARALGMTQPTIGRQIAALEDELDVLLFERVGRGLELTTTGYELLEHVRAMGDAANRFSVAAAGHSVSLEGKVCVAASEAVAVHLLSPLVLEMRELYPGIDIEIVASIEVSDLLRREADIAIRNFQPKQVELVARRLKTSQARLYASPLYLERVGATRLEDLSDATFMGFDHGDAMLNGLRALGLDLSERNFRIISANQLVQWELTRRGAGISIMLEEIGDVDPSVVRVLPDLLASIPVPIWLTSHRELRTNRRVRAVFDHLAEGLVRPVSSGLS